MKAFVIRSSAFVPLYQKMREYQNTPRQQLEIEGVPLYQKMREYQNKDEGVPARVKRSFIPKDERVPKLL